jgi:hypothetical protein
MCLVWSQLADIRTPPIVNSDFIYVRLIGDRSIQEKDFGRIQIDRIKEMKKVTRNFKDGTDRGNMSGVKFSIVIANNHYAGFGPGTVNIFRQLIGLEEVKWGDEYVMADDLAGKEDDDYNYNATLIKKPSQDFKVGCRFSSIKGTIENNFSLVFTCLSYKFSRLFSSNCS